MNLDRLSSFAEAAANLFKAAPWQHLANEDLIQIESPMPPSEALRCASIMGAGGDVLGISFFASRESFKELLDQEEPERIVAREGATALTFNCAENLPAGDGEFWLEKQLPLAADHAYPLLLRYPRREGFGRLDGASVTFVEGLCRALAQTTEEQIDSGQWEQVVQTCDGPVTYCLTIPPLIEAMQGVKPKFNPKLFDRRSLDADMRAIQLLMQQRKPASIDEINAIMSKELKGNIPKLPPPSTPLEQAQWLCFEAFEHRGRRRIQLAKQALSYSRDCADAYCLLAEQRGFDPVGANELFRQGVEAGRRALGDEPFAASDRPFWADVRCRPYMRARQGYAETLKELGRKQEATDEFAAMLKLNPNDNQGIRHQLAPLLLELNRLDELDELLGGRDFGDDGSAEWAYVRALLAFRRAARSQSASSTLRTAIGCNAHVPKYLLGRAPLPPALPPFYSRGDEREAMVVASSQKALWEQTPDALEWLSNCKRQLNQKSKDKRQRKRR